VLYLLLITNAEPNDPILVCFKPDVVVFEWWNAQQLN
jgi:hypothetical protein